MIGGMGWFAFNYGQMTAQRDHLAMQLNQYHQAPAKKVPAKPAAAPLSGTETPPESDGRQHPYG
ncbi:MAG: hypothetical protein EP152_04620 [Prevotella copri]|nr:hypothetical protein [Segatella copri]